MEETARELIFFFFSSRRRHTRWTGDWSSDVCSSDLDGAGILIQMPDAFLRRVCGRQGLTLPAIGQYGVGMVFLPQEPASRMACEQEIERAVAAEGQVLLGWRNVPTDNSGLSERTKEVEPVIRQVFIARGSNALDQDALERKL